MTPIFVLSSAFLRGPNVWARTPVFVQHCRLEPLEPQDIPEISFRVHGSLAGFVDPDSQHIPRESLDLTECDSLAALLARTSLNLQRLAGFDVEFCNWRKNEGNS